MAALKAGMRPTQGGGGAPPPPPRPVVAPLQRPPERGASVPPRPVNVVRPMVSPRAPINGASPHSGSNTVGAVATPTSATGSNTTPVGGACEAKPGDVKATPVVAVQLVPGHPAPPGYHVARKPDGTLVLVSDAQVQMAKLAAQPRE